MKQDSINDIQRTFAQIQAKYWLDPEFKQQLERFPNDVLRNSGFPVGPHVKVNVWQNTEKRAFFVIPPKPRHLSKPDMEVVLAAGTFGTAATVGSSGSVCGCIGCFGTFGTFGCADI